MAASVPSGWHKPVAGDLWGGLAAAAVALPQAIAFGATLLAPAGVDAAAGAFAGLVTAAALGLASGLLGRTSGLISAPTGPTLILLASLLAAASAIGVTGPGLLVALAATVFGAGLLQLALGLAGAGRLIKYIPFPVVSGFMTGSAILMVLSQLAPLRGAGGGTDWSDWRWLPAATAALTIVSVKGIPRLWPAVPGPLAGLVLGSAGFHLLAAMHGGTPPAAWLIGSLPGFDDSSAGVPWSALATIPWAVVLPAAAALALLASLNTLLTSVVADVATGTRHDTRRELAAQGLGQMVAALAGGMGGSATTAATVTAIRFGGRRWAGAICGALFLVLMGVAGELGRWLPVGTLAGIILVVASDVADRDILRWARQGRTRQDAAVAVLVTSITVFYDLMTAVGAGVAIAAFLFVVEQIRAPVVHRRSTGRDMRSIRTRSDRARALLDAHGERIVVYELRGNLFFGTADRLLDQIEADLDGPNRVVLHLGKVARIDLTAIRLLAQMAARLHEHGGQLMLCDLHHGAGIGANFAEALALAGGRPSAAPVPTFNGRDEALECAEDALLEELAGTTHRSDAPVDLAHNALCRYLDADQIARFASLLERRTVAAHAELFDLGELSDELYLVTHGQIEIRLATTTHHHKRLALYGPGTFFGELALLEGGARAARAVASATTELLVLTRARFETIKRAHPDIAIGLLTALADTLVANQRWSTREIQRLSEW